MSSLRLPLSLSPSLPFSSNPSLPFPYSSLFSLLSPFLPFIPCFPPTTPQVSHVTCAGLKFRCISASASQVLRFQACTTAGFWALLFPKLKSVDNVQQSQSEIMLSVCLSLAIYPSIHPSTYSRSMLTFLFFKITSSQPDDSAC